MYQENDLGYGKLIDIFLNEDNADVLALTHSIFEQLPSEAIIEIISRGGTTRREKVRNQSKAVLVNKLRRGSDLRTVIDQYIKLYSERETTKVQFIRESFQEAGEPALSHLRRYEGLSSSKGPRANVAREMADLINFTGQSLGSEDENFSQFHPYITYLNRLSAITDKNIKATNSVLDQIQEKIVEMIKRDHSEPTSYRGESPKLDIKKEHADSLAVTLMSSVLKARPGTQLRADYQKRVYGVLALLISSLSSQMRVEVGRFVADEFPIQLPQESEENYRLTMTILIQVSRMSDRWTIRGLDESLYGALRRVIGSVKET